ncbi:MAG: magnesium/cobalt transporter CorA [Chloroflexi bacterium]|nr:magnesium/cobalt transporter CorA [Chloroflexota bacterium]
MIETVLSYGQNGLEQVADLGQISDLLESAENLVWLDVCRPTEVDLRLLREEFGFHELAIEDVSRAHQRPKLDEYEGYSFIVLYGARRPAGGPLDLAEVDVFLGRNYLVTVRREPMPALAEMVERWRHNRAAMGAGVYSLLYALLDVVVDGYFPIVDGIAEEVEDLEEQIFTASSRVTLQRLFGLKKDLLALRRVVAPEREVVALLLRRDIPAFDRRVSPYFQDVYDHIIRVVDSVDLHQDLLTGALDAHLSTVSNSLNFVMKRLTAITVILMLPTLIAGIYGMNFHLTPSQEWGGSFPLVLGMMLAVTALLGVAFKRSGWL